MSFDPDWKKRLEEKRAARGVVVPVAGSAQKPTAAGQGCLKLLVALFGGVMLLISLGTCEGGAKQKQPAPPVARQPGPVAPVDEARAAALDREREAALAKVMREIEAEAQWIDLAELCQGLENQLAWEKKWAGKKGRIVGVFVKASREFGGAPFLLVRGDGGEEVKVLLVGASLPAWAADRKVGERVVMRVAVKGISRLGDLVNLDGLDAQVVGR